MIADPALWNNEVTASVLANLAMRKEAITPVG